jgi:hypothetical protein
MTRFADHMMRASDTARVDQIRKDEAKRFADQFAPAQAKAARNLASWNAPRTFALA